MTPSETTDFDVLFRWNPTIKTISESQFQMCVRQWIKWNWGGKQTFSQSFCLLDQQKDCLPPQAHWICRFTKMVYFQHFRYLLSNKFLFLVLICNISFSKPPYFGSCGTTHLYPYYFHVRKPVMVQKRSCICFFSTKVYKITKWKTKNTKHPAQEIIGRSNLFFLLHWNPKLKFANPPYLSDYYREV